ncbi:WD40 repeat domain-containing protein [Gemmata sp.]|uniref:WD40 repeat domain-containing protein n=1 Tax=Gemmata sp. TaxID=1914242 RepID=UPI003F6FCF34
MWIQPVDGSVQAIAFSPDGRTLYTQDASRWFTAWDPATHEGRRLFQYPERSSNHFPRMFASPDGRYLVANTSPALVWNLETREVHAEVPPKFAYAGVSVGAGGGRVECVADDWLGVRTWDYVRQEAGDELRDWDVPDKIKTHHFAPGGRTVALLSWSDTVTICDVESRKAIQTIDAPKQALQHARFAPDGDTLVLYGSDGVTVWDVPSAAVRVAKIACDRPYWMLAFHPTAPVAAVRRTDGLLSLVSLRTGEEVRALDFDLGRYAACAGFSPDGLTCAVGGTDSRFAVFDVDV